MSSKLSKLEVELADIQLMAMLQPLKQWIYKQSEKLLELKRNLKEQAKAPLQQMSRQLHNHPARRMIMKIR